MENIILKNEPTGYEFTFDGKPGNSVLSGVYQNKEVQFFNIDIANAWAEQNNVTVSISN